MNNNIKRTIADTARLNAKDSLCAPCPGACMNGVKRKSVSIPVSIAGYIHASQDSCKSNIIIQLQNCMHRIELYILDDSM